MGVLSITYGFSTHTRTGKDYAIGITRTYYARTTYVQETPMDHANVCKFGHKGSADCLCILLRWYICVRLCYSNLLKVRLWYAISFRFGCRSSFCYSYSISLRLALKATQEQALGHWYLNWRWRRGEILCNLRRMCALLRVYRWKCTHPHMCVQCKMYGRATYGHSLLTFSKRYCT